MIVTWTGEVGRCAGLRRLSAHNLPAAATELASYNDQLDYDTPDSLLRPQQ